MKITPFFKWYDFWVGLYFDKNNKTAYICLIPMFGLKLDFRSAGDINEAIWNNVFSWQLNNSVHPLTCGNNSEHIPLFPKLEDGKVVLKCHDCGYKQEVPNFLKTL